MIGCDTLTIWRRGEGRAPKSVIAGCRVEDSFGASAAQVGPDPSRELKAFLFGDFDVAEGDWVVPRVCDSAEPPEDARRVAKIARWTSRYRFHHLEVTAR